MKPFSCTTIRFLFTCMFRINLLLLLLVVVVTATTATADSSSTIHDHDNNHHHEEKEVLSLQDYSNAVVGLFNNMRTPAALISGAIVPLGLLSAPTIQKANNNSGNGSGVGGGDSKRMKLIKKINILLAVTSLLSEILAVTYASIAINKLVEMPQPHTTSVAELIQQKHELAWIGTNIHFLYGMMGFGLIVGMKVYFTFGETLGNLAIGWSLAAFLQALSIVNTGIAQGHGKDGDMNSRFASNFFFLNIRYIELVSQHAQGGICAMAAIVVAVVTGFQTIKMFFRATEEDDDTPSPYQNENRRKSAPKID